MVNHGDNHHDQIRKLTCADMADVIGGQGEGLSIATSVVSGVMAVPGFQIFNATQKAGAVSVALDHIYTLPLSYHGDNDTYGIISDIGFSEAK